MDSFTYAGDQHVVIDIYLLKDGFYTNWYLKVILYSMFQLYYSYRETRLSSFVNPILASTEGRDGETSYVSGKGEGAGTHLGIPDVKI